MRTTLGFLRHRYALASIVVAGLVLSVWGLYPSPVVAQGGIVRPDRVYSSGPFQLQDGERVRIGLLLPAVQKIREAANFSVLNGSGERLYGTPIGPSGNASSFFDVFFDITYRSGGQDYQNGVFEIRGKGVPGGGDDVVTVPSPDGILIGLLLPAVQRSGKTISPLATSMQSFNAAGGTMTHSFFDVFFDVF